MTDLATLLADPARAGVWTLQPDRSTVAFRSKSMWGLMPVKGRFTEFGGEGQITDAQTVFGRLDIKAASMDTKICKRDEHLRTPDFFDVEKHPDINVLVTGADAGSAEVRAELTIRGTTAPLPLKVDAEALDDGAVRVRGEGRVNRKDFGVDGNMLGMITDDVTVSADLVFSPAR